MGLQQSANNTDFISFISIDSWMFSFLMGTEV